MSNQSLTNVYQMIMDDVIKNIKPEFENDGVDEQVLVELQQLWEMKLHQSGAMPSQRDDYGAGAADFLYPHSQLGMNYNPRALPHLQQQQQFQFQQPGPFGMPPANRGPTTTPSGMYNHHYIPQADGVCEERETAATAPERQTQGQADAIPQLDGKNDTTATRDLDAEELSGMDSEGEEEPETEDFVLCQFDKVQRTKNKWKVNLKDGIMHIGGREYIFHKAMGEFEW